jgi:inhibitor of the pro-sigma K processing machinery
MIPAILAASVLRLLFLPVRFIWKLLVNSLCGFACLWLLNTASGVTGLYLPINAVTVLVTGFLGLPGVGVVAVLELMG